MKLSFLKLRQQLNKKFSKFLFFFSFLILFDMTISQLYILPNITVKIDDDRATRASGSNLIRDELISFCALFFLKRLLLRFLFWKEL